MRYRKTKKEDHADIEPRVPFREKLKDKNFRLFLIFFGAAIILTVVSFSFDGYLKQAAVIAGTVLYVLALKFLGKYNKSRGKHYVRDFFRGVGKYLRRIYETVKAKAFELLGIKPRSAFMKGKDEKDAAEEKEPGFFDKLFSFTRRPKWKDMETDSQKVRFIYQRFLVRTCKKGYKLMASHTHNDFHDAAPKYVKKSRKDLDPLFDSYETARYSRGVSVPGETIEELKRI